MVWDRPAIIAEIRRRDSSLTKLANDNGVPRTSLSWALIQAKPRFNRIIADFLGVPPHVLWPEWFSRRGTLISTKPIDRITRGASRARVRRAA